MCKCLKLMMMFPCLFLFTSTVFAATVSWQNSTQNAPWVDKGTITTTAWDNDNTNTVTVTEQTMYQEFFGHGGCFNEVGWKCLMKLSQSTRDSVMKLLFDSTGCNFNVCRVVLGCNDYTVQAQYSLDETSGDYSMTNFSISKDQTYLIPFMKAATAVNPKLKIWGSPWSPPSWMKNSGTYNSGHIKTDAQTFTALALYFAKAVKAYQQQGLHYFAVMPCNEPYWNVSMGYPVCGWKSTELRDFIKSYLGPEFKKDDVPGEIYMGTILNDADDAGSTTMTKDVYSDSTAYSYCTGGGFQYVMPANYPTNYPDKLAFETETPCGGSTTSGVVINDWPYAVNNDGNMQTFYKGGVNVYSQWNMVLDPTGTSIAGWHQCCMIQIDTNTKKVTFAPQFYQVRHYSYVKDGAFRVASTSANGNIATIAFRNRDGENVLIVTNKGGDAAVAINFNGQKIKPTIPGSSFNTFRIAGTPIPAVSAFSKVEAEKFSLQSGILIRPCSDGGSGVTLIENNDWTVYHNVDFGTGAITFEARVSGVGGGSIEVHLDSSNGVAAGTCAVAASSAWSTVTCPVNGVSGKHDLYLKFKGTVTGTLFNLNWFDFVAGASGTAPLAGTQAACGNTVRVVSNTGNSQSLRFYFSPLALQGKIDVCLFDLSGRRVTTLFAGRLSSRDLMLPLNRNEIRPGAYLIKVSLNGDKTLTKKIALQ